jgi:predicted NAD/FAD-binding protein
LKRQKFGKDFIQDHVLPMAAAIWSAAPEDILNFPARSFGRFYENHGLLELDSKKRPAWRTIDGGSRVYVEKILEEAKPTIVKNAAIVKINGGTNGATLTFADGSTAQFDHVIIAAHADEAAALLDDKLSHKAALKPFRYAINTTYLHSDSDLMPKRKSLWASWNYMGTGTAGSQSVFVTYWMNLLQSIDRKIPLFVSLNPATPPAWDKTIKQMTYHHPQFDNAAMQAQEKLKFVQGQENIWLCGSYFGYGFHEDAFASGLAVAEALGVPRPWKVTDVSPAFNNATPARRNV